MTNKFFLLTLLFFLLLNFSQPIKANDLLRLFTTHQERTKLNKALEPPPRTTDEETKKKQGPQPPRYITFNGIVKRSQGPLTIWINGQNDLKQPGFEVKLNNLTQSTVSIHLKGTKKTILLKPGQTVDTLDNTIKDYFVHSLITEE